MFQQSCDTSQSRSWGTTLAVGRHELCSQAVGEGTSMDFLCSPSHLLPEP